MTQRAAAAAAGWQRVAESACSAPGGGGARDEKVGGRGHGRARALPRAGSAGVAISGYPKTSPGRAILYLSFALDFIPKFPEAAKPFGRSASEAGSRPPTVSCPLHPSSLMVPGYGLPDERTGR